MSSPRLTTGRPSLPHRLAGWPVFVGDSDRARGHNWLPNLVLIITTVDADGTSPGLINRMKPWKVRVVNPWKVGNRMVGIDPELRRLWVGGQRLHHGVTGIAFAGAGIAQ